MNSSRFSPGGSTTSFSVTSTLLCGLSSEAQSPRPLTRSRTVRHPSALIVKRRRTDSG
jgi:hypothetical protein